MILSIELIEDTFQNSCGEVLRRTAASRKARKERRYTNASKTDILGPVRYEEAGQEESAASFSGRVTDPLIKTPSYSGGDTRAVSRLVKSGSKRRTEETANP
ncbi:MAG: uncharacterized protein A8A55_0493 [Amphiamblys sp. WSBS2006]|nr:MAG: uncharacterized protein A8A55_0493 [Amphiamblys sp. WSBS2006]